jgi:hypothetical protein
VIFQDIFKLFNTLAHMILEIIDGVFAISAGTITLVLWIVVLIKKLGNKFIEQPFERLFHILAEFVMSIIAIIGGIALLFQQTWALPLFFLAMGLILYAVINAIGIYREKKYKLLVLILTTTSIITIALIAISFAMLVL